MNYISKITDKLYLKYKESKDIKTNRKVLIIESDDWGSIRVPSLDAYNKLISLGYAMDKRPYERFDTLENDEDIEELFNVLLKHKDANGNHPVITANMLMANPAFDKIKGCNFTEYHYEKIDKTYNRYKNSSNVLSLMKKGIDLGVFMPQSHGREHFNITKWLDALRHNDKDILTAFEYKMCGIFPKESPQTGNKFLIALNNNNNNEQEEINLRITDGLQLFHEQWGFSSTSFIAPCYCWNDSIEKTLHENEVKIIQSGRIQKDSSINNKKYYRHCGERNKNGQIYTVRNAAFEPSTINVGNDINKLLAQIDRIFKQRNIAIISSHRINYVSGISKLNRENNLKLLDKFLCEVIKRHPDIEFISTDKLTTIFTKP